MTQMTFEDAMARQPHHDGKTYDPSRDQKRLNAQTQKVFDVISDGRKRTLREIADITQSPEASVSARLRDLRKPRFGGYVIQKEHLGNGLYRYWMDNNQSTEQKA